MMENIRNKDETGDGRSHPYCNETDEITEFYKNVMNLQENIERKIYLKRILDFHNSSI